MGLNGISIIPTGYNAAIGGDAAANPQAKLLASCCDNLIVNPNHVNASDINQMPENCLYTEGSIIDRFLEGKLNLQKVKTFNKILLAVNSPVAPTNINSMNAGIWGNGSDVSVIGLHTPLKMNAIVNSDGSAGGTYSGVDELIEQVKDLNFDVLAIQTPIDCNPVVARNYWRNGGVNPWGQVEAQVSKHIANKLNKPIAHGPCDTDQDTLEVYNNIVVKRTMAPEAISSTYLFCVIKGLHRAPRLIFDLTERGENILTNKDIDFLITPHGLFGRPHLAAAKLNIPIIVIMENTTCYSNDFKYSEYKNLIFVENYLEAAGVVMSMTAGIDYRTILLDGESL